MEKNHRRGRAAELHEDKKQPLIHLESYIQNITFRGEGDRGREEKKEKRRQEKGVSRGDERRGKRKRERREKGKGERGTRPERRKRRGKKEEGRWETGEGS